MWALIKLRLNTRASDKWHIYKLSVILPLVILVSQIQFVLLAWFKIYFLDYFALEVTSGEVLSNSKF